ncbi:vacuolar protein sorting-associated protein 41 homolog isoform X3 [Quercus suber]|uniref:vacuolar protein sorting-associated protein 41 homolog isoform X3 n=1 Tax=Quercus suber TaxID=58331 RepID=UPI0032DFAA12
MYADTLIDDTARSIRKRGKEAFLSALGKPSKTVDTPTKFCDMQGHTSKGEENIEGPAWAPLLDNYMLTNSKLKDWDNMLVVQLMTIDCKHAVPLLIQNKDVITPSDVVSQLLNSSNKCDNRYFLHLYLHSLFEVNPHSGKDFHDMQVELYADYDPKMLLPFLCSSQHYNLEKANETCIRRDLLREQVFILGRMGNSRQAPAVIINKLGDIKEVLSASVRLYLCQLVLKFGGGIR